MGCMCAQRCGRGVRPDTAAGIYHQGARTVVGGDMKKALTAAAAILLLAGCSAEPLAPEPTVTVTVTAPAPEPVNESVQQQPRSRVVPDLVELYLSEALTGVSELRPRVFDATDGTEMDLDELWQRGWYVYSQEPVAGTGLPPGDHEIYLYLIRTEDNPAPAQEEPPPESEPEPTGESIGSSWEDYYQWCADKAQETGRWLCGGGSSSSSRGGSSGSYGGYSGGSGYTVRCNDGSYSQSGGRQGACSWHGGVDD
jgi:uncharacterized membrane protein YgcG